MIQMGRTQLFGVKRQFGQIYRGIRGLHFMFCIMSGVNKTTADMACCEFA